MSVIPLAALLTGCTAALLLDTRKDSQVVGALALGGTALACAAYFQSGERLDVLAGVGAAASPLTTPYASCEASHNALYPATLRQFKITI